MHDLLVIGAGIAGLATAIKAAPHCSVLLLTKGPRPDGSTNYAQGGIASVTHPEDSFEFHIQDTLLAGDGLCKPSRVRLLARSGPDTIAQLAAWGVRFTRDGDSGSWHLALEGGHSKQRILHARDLTGKEIMRALLLEIRRHPNITFEENQLVTDLWMDHTDPSAPRCCGAYVTHRETLQRRAVQARCTVLSTGGAGELWQHSTNPAVSTGDGIAIAWRAGAAVQDLEFMQFHPTALYAPQARKTFLISEAVRGHGGILRNHQGKPFMDVQHPLKSLAPRDIVARAIHREMIAEGKPHMWLDITHRDAAETRKHFPNIYAHCLEQGMDITRQWIPVVPAAHYMCGGVLVNSRSRTQVPGLWAVGEVAATGVHGANRLASNSLLESVTFALRAWDDIQKELGHSLSRTTPPSVAMRGLSGAKGAYWVRLKQELQQLMWECAGILRERDHLQIGLLRLQEIQSNAETALLSEHAPTLSLLELRNMVQSALLVVRSALARRESRGLHCLLEYPSFRAGPPRHTTLRPDTEKSVGLESQ